ncbi:molecular chaperone [Achromobacter seleniivolatilans]|uniref:Molecular chaperone n=1 Tax=Achromobacter seleniivolatilans TaxID=3047478 RepID=A0ABY9LU74_9BURK|nr:molecular chaperone [Achromobacter sp. R39]WMD18307.1 molecular chaperone [Achromobacter sp. R39]
MSDYVVFQRYSRFRERHDADGITLNHPMITMFFHLPGTRAPAWSHAVRFARIAFRTAGQFCAFAGLRALLLLLGAAGLPQPAFAHLDFEGMNRFIFPSDVQRLPVFITNRGQDPTLLQSTLVWGDGQTADLPLALSKPLQVVRPGQKGDMEIFYEGRGFPDDRESYLMLSVLDVPKRPQEANLVQIAIQHHFKLFFRPALNMTTGEAIAKLTWTLPSQDSAALLISNPSPYYITLSDIALTDQAGQACGTMIDHVMVAPFSEAAVTAADCGKKMSGASYQYVSDDGTPRAYRVRLEFGTASPGSPAI